MCEKAVYINIKHFSFMMCSNEIYMTPLMRSAVACMWSAVKQGIVGNILVHCPRFARPSRGLKGA